MINLPLLALAAAIAGQTTTAPTTAPARPTTGQPGTPATTTPPTAAMPSATTTAPQAATTTTAPVSTATNPTVGGVAMPATNNIVQNAAAAPNLSTLVSAVKAAGLDTTLAGPGPFTVFAPTNEAFNRLAPGTVTTLMKPENKASLTKLLTYHVVPGTITLDQLKQQITAGGGKATLTTVEGETLTAATEGAALSLTDSHGNKAYLQTPDVRQSNGVVHIVNGVLVPKALG